MTPSPHPDGVSVSGEEGREGGSDVAPGRAIVSEEDRHTEQARALAGEWHRRAQSLWRHNGMERGEAALANEQRAQVLTDCAEELEKIVGNADPF